MNEWQEKLDDLKRDPLFPFPDYAKNLSHYYLAELYWRYLFRSLIQDAEWRPWHTPDTTGEGNPIFSAIDLPFRRGVRIIQHPESRSSTPVGKKHFGFQPFLSITTAQPYDPHRTVLEFCCVADISDETEARCLTFWRRFCIDLAPEKQMEDEIRAYEAEVEMPAS